MSTCGEINKANVDGGIHIFSRFSLTLTMAGVGINMKGSVVVIFINIDAVTQLQGNYALSHRVRTKKWTTHITLRHSLKISTLSMIKRNNAPYSSNKWMAWNTKHTQINPPSSRTQSRFIPYLAPQKLRKISLCFVAPRSHCHIHQIDCYNLWELVENRATNTNSLKSRNILAQNW